MYFVGFCVNDGYGIEWIIALKWNELQMIGSIRDDQSPSNKTKDSKLIKKYEVWTKLLSQHFIPKVLNEWKYKEVGLLFDSSFAW
jgi:hypothetical protein